MKVLLVQDLPYAGGFGGAERSNRLLLERLGARGHDCHLLASAVGATRVLGGAGAPPHPVDDVRAGVSVRTARSTSGLRGLLVEELRRLEPDWVLVSSEDAAQLLLAAALDAAPGRVVYLARTTLGLPCGPGAGMPSAARTALLLRARAVLAPSRFLATYLATWAGVDAQVLPISPIEPPAGAPRRDGPGCVGMINPCSVKGISIFLELARRNPDRHFAAVPTWGTTAGDRSTLAACPNVRLLEPTPDLDALFAPMEVLLVPSLWQEGYGRSVLEAMARGVPVLAADVGGLPEAKLGVDHLVPVEPIVHWRRGLSPSLEPRLDPVVPEQNVEPWQQALDAVLADPRRTLAERSRAAARRFLDGQDLDGLERLLQGLGGR